MYIDSEEHRSDETNKRFTLTNKKCERCIVFSKKVLPWYSDIEEKDFHLLCGKFEKFHQLTLREEVLALEIITLQNGKHVGD